MGNLPFERAPREVFIRKESSTSEKYGKRPEELTLKELENRCIIVLDKPAGPTSHQTSDYLKKLIKVKKAGHSGTLDPQVTGVLPVAVGKATRIVQALLMSGKEYVCLMHLHQEHDPEDIKKAVMSFVGKIKQLPPIKSAVKRQWRYRKIYYIEILDIADNKDVLFKVGCQAGTYIRKLCHDMGLALGSGAHMAELRRTKAGPFGEQDASNLHDISDAIYYAQEEGQEEKLKKIVHPVEDGIAHLPKIWVHDSTVESLCQGVALKTPGISKVESDIQVEDEVAVMTLKGELILVGRALMISKQMVKEARGLTVKTGQVFMEPGVYPRREK